MQRYESYKPSEIPWIDELPQHWGEEKGKWLHRFRKDLNNRKLCDNVLSLTLRGVVNNDPDDPEGLVPKDYGTYQIFDKDDLVFKLIDLENFRTSRVGLVHERGIMSPAYLRVQPGKEHNPHYFYYYYFTLYQQDIYNKLGAGVRSTLGPTDLLEIGVPVPSKDEQDRIVAFLDHKTAEIDVAIAKKERLIDLLCEQKDLLVTRAVLAGLNSEASTKPCEIDGIDSIPSHWKVVANRRLFREKAKKYKGEALPPLSLSQKDGLVPTDEMKERSLKTSSYEHFRICRAGDLVLNRFKAHLGVFFAAKQGGVVTFHYGIYTPEQGVSSKYFELLFHTNAFRSIYAGASNGMTVGLQNLSNQNFYDVKSICPPLDEQIEIVNYVIGLENRYEALTLSIEKELASLRELKKLSVANAVIGKIKV